MPRKKIEPPADTAGEKNINENSETGEIAEQPNPETTDVGALLAALDEKDKLDETAEMLVNDGTDILPPISDEISENAETVKQSEEILFIKNTKSASAPKSRKRVAASDILTIEAKSDVETPESLEEIAWHEIKNAYITRRILTGVLGSIERTDKGIPIVVVHYGDFRVLIPFKEMMTDWKPFIRHVDKNYNDTDTQQSKILAARLGSEIDFIVKGIEDKTRSIVASRREAMLKKRRTFYLNADESGEQRVRKGRIVQARIIAVAEKTVRVEIFGVECSVFARNLNWGWIGDARDHFSVGDEILLRILEVKVNSLEDIIVQADGKSVTDIYKGVVYLRLSNGVNAVAHTCYDKRMPGRKDEVSFVVNQINDDFAVAVGAITRIIRQNL